MCWRRFIWRTEATSCSRSHAIPWYKAVTSKVPSFHLLGLVLNSSHDSPGFQGGTNASQPINIPAALLVLFSCFMLARYASQIFLYFLFSPCSLSCSHLSFCLLLVTHAKSAGLSVQPFFLFFLNESLLYSSWRVICFCFCLRGAAAGAQMLMLHFWAGYLSAVISRAAGSYCATCVDLIKVLIKSPLKSRVSQSDEEISRLSLEQVEVL